MIKKLPAVGNDFALTIRPAGRPSEDRVSTAADELLDAHEATFRKLAK